MLLDDSEQAFGEIIIALIEFIMICWLGIGNFPPCIIYLMVHIEHAIYLRYPPQNLVRLHTILLDFISFIIFTLLQFPSWSNHQLFLCIHMSTDVTKRGGDIGTYGSYRFPYIIVRKRTIFPYRNIQIDKLYELINTQIDCLLQHHSPEVGGFPITQGCLPSPKPQ